MINEITVFNTKANIAKIKELYQDSKTLKELDFKVSVGSVVWNQEKENLTDDTTQTRLIYNTDIVDNKLTIVKYKNPNKKNYIKTSALKSKTPITKPVLIVNRGYGKCEYTFSHSIINLEKPFILENHVICIQSQNSDNHIEDYKKIIKSFQNEKTKNFVKLYFGNNAINTSEIYSILPIYDF